MRTKEEILQEIIEPIQGERPGSWWNRFAIPCNQKLMLEVLLDIRSLLNERILK